jgi:hypothetical protein
VEVREEGVRLTPKGQLYPTMFQNGLCRALWMRSVWTKSVDDLNAAIDVSQEAAASAPENHPNRAGYLSNLRHVLHARYLGSGSMTDLDAAVNALTKSSESRFSRPITRIDSATEGAELYYSRNFVSDASRMLTAAARLLPTASPRTLRRDDQQYTIRENKYSDSGGN